TASTNAKLLHSHGFCVIAVPHCPFHHHYWDLEENQLVRRAVAAKVTFFQHKFLKSFLLHRLWEISIYDRIESEHLFGFWS
ncbi:hypothetical protein D478_05789, partial [Brevibacillus agri BAB-2500]